MVSLFCRHNRFTAECPICSRGTVLDSPGSGSGRTRSQSQPSGARQAEEGPRSGRQTATRSGRRGASRPAAVYRGPYASTGPYERDGESYEVRLERVPGGLRLAEWSAGSLSPSAPVLAAGDLPALVEGAADSRALEPAEHAALAGALADVPPDPAAAAALSAAPRDDSAAPGAGAAAYGASPGRSGELREELRVEQLDGGRLRIARWVLRPGTGWDLLDAPTMLPARRYAEALAHAARLGLLAG